MAEPWQISDHPHTAKAQAWFQPVLAHGTTFMAENLRTQIAFLRQHDLEFPLSINDQEWDNSWVCSPWTHYVSCGQEEVQRFAPKWLAQLSEPLWRGLGGWLQRAELNRVVMVNNWLLSTVPWPRDAARAVPTMLETLMARWPQHAFVFRSLNAMESAPLLQALGSLGAWLIPSRQVWWFPPESAAVAAARDFKQDRKLLHRGDLQVVAHEELREEDFPSLRALYAQLYLEKYSPHNPRFTAAWLRAMHQSHQLHFTALRSPDRRLLGVEAYAEHHGTLTSPVVGYDLRAPRELGLYRRLAVIPVLAGRRLGLPLNMSAGVGNFKAARGGQPVMEYMAVFAKHLSNQRQRPWRLIHQLSEHVLAPAVRRWKL